MKICAYGLACLLVLLPLAGFAQSFLSPCQAIARAERHFREKGIDTAGQHIQNLRRHYDSERRMLYWEINWAWDTARLGMEHSARVFADGQVEWRRLGP